MLAINEYETKQLKTDLPVVKPGDTVRVHTKIKEGEKERIQIFEGIVIKKRGSKNRETFTVRKMSYGVGVERVFPLHSPMIAKIEIKQRGDVKRAKLYYLRKLFGKAARIAEKREWEKQREVSIQEEFGAEDAAEETVELKKEQK